MTLQQNDTLQDASLVQAMLTAVFVNLVSAFVILVDALSFLSSKCSLKYVKTLVASFLAKDKLVDPLKIPHHMAVAFGADEFISVTLLCDLILYAARDGIRQLSFYDPNGRIAEAAPELEVAWHRTAKRTNLRRYVYFDAAKSTPGTTTTAPRTSSTGLQVCVLSRRHGKEALVNICAELSQTKDEITVEAVRRQLELQGVYEVDFLVTVGCTNTMRDFPPWALRVAEICPLAGFAERDRLRPGEFHALLSAFSKRERRLGY
ncbi:Ditrans,polycis-polyprenyl diphosphate synthase ((2E,6E)-farnesyldiphosphate specific) [Aphelenchoides fujianensis]|nr:Ditrans,polycis-polyprenyl diphosphate synthase ((2E,6E)-farnesyldiphosphate specific) [Aphelenchoides fujianensis]